MNGLQLFGVVLGIVFGIPLMIVAFSEDGGSTDCCHDTGYDPLAKLSRS